MSMMTPDEPWITKRGAEAFYVAGADFALQSLGDGDGKSCLVVGSPIFEAVELQGRGWAVTYLDIRKPPSRVHWVCGDASEMPFEDETFDALSSTCVMCHVGLGRYGDALRSDGDIRMMREIKRVVRKGGKCVVTVGPAADCGNTRSLGSMHKVYVVADAQALAAEAGLAVLRTEVWGDSEKRWREPGEALTAVIERPDYLSMLVQA